MTTCQHCHTEGCCSMIGNSIMMNGRLAAVAEKQPPGRLGVRLKLPNSAHLQNITAFISTIEPDDCDRFELEMHPTWVSVHPVVLALTGAAAAKVAANGGAFSGIVPSHTVFTLPDKSLSGNIKRDYKVFGA